MKLRSVASLLAAGIAVSVAVAAWEGYRLSKARDFNRLVDSGIDAAATQDTPQAEFARALSLAQTQAQYGGVGVGAHQRGGFPSSGRDDAQPALVVIGRRYITERASAPVQYNGIV